MFDKPDQSQIYQLNATASLRNAIPIDIDI